MLHHAVAPKRERTIGADRWPLGMLVHRFGLFLFWQALIALGYALRGEANPWQASVAWWPVTATLTNLVSVLLLRRLAGREGLGYWQMVGADFRREHVGKDLLWFLGVLALAGPVAMLPNFGLAQVLFGDSQVAVGLFVRPLPGAVALASLVLFPVTISFAELPTYFGYVMPRLEARWGRWAAILTAAFWLAAQHVTLPLIWDVRFVLWRLGMFIPFALLLGVALRLRPRLMPYLMATHALMDLSVALMVWQASAG